jgi:hypothetical protein
MQREVLDCEVKVLKNAWKTLTCSHGMFKHGITLVFFLLTLSLGALDYLTVFTLA